MSPDTLLKDFAIIMAAGAAALVLFRLIRQPPVLGYILVGALIGPYVFNGLTVSDDNSIRRIADLGLVVLLFTLGVEFGWQRIRKAGRRAIFIGLVETGLMLWLGFTAGRALGWTGMESLFLGAALAQTSSAVLIKYFRDTGQLATGRGQLIVAVSVVEDLLAVVLLSILTGVATTGASSPREMSELTFKLAVFGASALVFGTLLAPRLLAFTQRFASAEVLLMVSLGLCFGLGLIANDLGMSAAAGAFLIGTVVGDSSHANNIQRITTPVRDMFGAIFFVSVGMLIDFKMLGSALVPLLVIVPVFIAGKVAVNALAAFLAGMKGRESVEVGTGMPAMGEFGLAISKVGADNGVVGPVLYPVTAGTVAVSALLYPLVQRSGRVIVAVFDDHSPPALRRLGAWVEAAVARARRAVSGREVHGQVRLASRLVVVNVVMIGILLAAGAMALRWARELWGLGVGDGGLLGLVTGAAVITLCVPPGLIVWRALADLATKATGAFIERRLGQAGHERRLKVARGVQRVLLGLALVVAVVWALPFVRELFSIGSLFSLWPAVALVVTVVVTARLAVRVHGAMETAFRRTILGE